MYPDEFRVREELLRGTNPRNHSCWSYKEPAIATKNQQLLQKTSNCYKKPASACYKKCQLVACKINKRWCDKTM